MQPVDLKTALREFFSSYLLEQKQVSPHTLKSYRDTFKLLLEFARSKTGTAQLQLADLTIPLILDFLKHLEDDRIGRGNSAATRNYRLVAIRAFFKYLSWQWPALERQAQRIKAIPVKRFPTVKRDYLTGQELNAVFSQVDASSPEGFRDLAILIFLYNTGARASEAADTRISWFDFSGEVVTITGKGNKQRTLPVWGVTIKAAQTYLRRYRRAPKSSGHDFLFISQRGERFTRFGMRCLVQKYIQRAQARCKSLQSKRISTHSLRHTCAMHLLEAGVELNVVREWLGHTSLSSTGIYTHFDLSHKRAALAKFGPPIYVTSCLEQKEAASTDQLLDWLKDL